MSPQLKLFPSAYRMAWVSLPADGETVTVPSGEVWHVVGVDRCQVGVDRCQFGADHAVLCVLVQKDDIK